MQDVAATAHRRGYQTAIETGEAAAMRQRQSQKIAVGELLMTKQSVDVEARLVEQANVIGPEGMAPLLPETPKHACHNRRGTRHIGISRMTDDAQDVVLCDRAGCPPSPLVAANHPCTRSWLTWVGSISATSTLTSSKNVKEPRRATR